MVFGFSRFDPTAPAPGSLCRRGRHRARPAGSPAAGMPRRHV